MKKKALITATAVLLVAVMCLATASYAWFTSGSADKVTAINLSVAQGDSSGLVIAPANAQNGSYTAGTYTVAELTANDLSTYAILPAEKNGAKDLLPVSTDGSFGTEKAGFYDFYAAPTSTYDGKYWDAKVAAHNEYMLVSFYVKNTGADGSFTVDLSSQALFSQAYFYNTCKIGYNVVDATETAGIPAAMPTDLTIGRCVPATEQTVNPTAYNPLVGAKDDSIWNDGSKFAATDASILGEEIADTTTIASIDLGAMATDSVKLVTVAVWLEGQDYDTKGTVNVNASDFTIEVNAVATGA